MSSVIAAPIDEARARYARARAVFAGFKRRQRKARDRVAVLRTVIPKLQAELGELEAALASSVEEEAAAASEIESSKAALPALYGMREEPG